MNKPSGSKPKPNPAPPSKNVLTNLEERVYNLEAEVAALVLECDKNQPIRSTNNEHAGINVNKAEFVTYILDHVFTNNDFDDLRQMLSKHSFPKDPKSIIK